MTKPEYNTKNLGSGKIYNYILELYENVLEVCKNNDFNKITLYLYFEKKVVEQIISNINLDRGLEFGWLKLCSKTNFKNFIKCAEYFLSKEK